LFKKKLLLIIIKLPVAARIKDWQECVYCMELYSSGQELLDHFHKEHNKFVFQCSLCFYRSASESNVNFHQEISHKEQNHKIYLCQKELLKSEVPSFVGVLGNFIKPYVCKTGEYFLFGHKLIFPVIYLMGMVTIEVSFERQIFFS